MGKTKKKKWVRRDTKLKKGQCKCVNGHPLCWGKTAKRPKFTKGSC